MSVRLCRVAALMIAVIGAASCDRPVGPAHTPQIALNTAAGEDRAFVEVTGIPAAMLRSLERVSLTRDQWTDVLRVAISPDAPAVLGEHAVADGSLRFTPLFPFDAGRIYHVRFDPGRVPGAPADMGAIAVTLSRPAPPRAPVTTVTGVYPSGDTVPANLLRMYAEFSSPMGRKSGVEHITLLDHAGQQIPGAILPLDYEFWSPDHTRFTIFFDPGRVKQGILPNQQMGRPLETGRTVTLVISREWRDEHGLPLKEDFRREFRVGPADEQPLDPTTWRLEAPAAGDRRGLVVSFPEPLDHGLLMRALGVMRDGQPVSGDITIDQAETRWTFTPAGPWQHGDYQLLALDILEDLAGNQVGRAFEVDRFRTVDRSPDPQSITIPFRVD